MKCKNLCAIIYLIYNNLRCLYGGLAVIKNKGGINMIENGNYRWLDYNSEKENLKNVFTAWYGEEYKDTVEERIDNIKYVPYHTYGYVREYYNKFLPIFRKEILDNFFEMTGLKRTKQREEVLLPHDAESIEDSYILNILQPDILINKVGEVSEDIFEEQDRMARDVKNAFGIKAKDDDDFEIKVAKLRYKLSKAIRKVIDNNPCDVFDDMLKVNENFDKATSEYLKYAQKLGFKFSEHDLDYLEHSKLLADDISVFDANGILFDNGTINSAGILDAYTTYADKILKSKKKDETNNINNIMYKRLKYMRMQGIPFAYLNEEVFDITSPYVFTNEQAKDLEKEYLEQEKLGNIPHFPTKMADLLEVKRRGLVDTLTDGCKFDKNLVPAKANGFEHNSQDRTQFFMLPYYRRNMTTRECRDLYFCEDEVYCDDNTLATLLHETNHAVSQKVITKDYMHGEVRCGLEVQDVKLLGEHILDIASSDTATTAIMENVNERQAQELLDIYLGMYGNTIPSGDDVLSKQAFNSLYAYSNFITQEFYDLFSEHFKRFNIDPEFDIYFKKTTPDTLVDILKEKASRKVNRRFNPAGYVGNNGILDYENVRKLGELCSIWEQGYVAGNENMITPDDLIMGTNFSELDDETINAIFEIRKRKDKIMADILSDAQKYGGYREYNQMQELLEQAQEEAENGGDIMEILKALGLEVQLEEQPQPDAPRSGTGKRGKLRQIRDEKENGMER